MMRPTTCLVLLLLVLPGAIAQDDAELLAADPGPDGIVGNATPVLRFEFPGLVQAPDPEAAEQPIQLRISGIAPLMARGFKADQQVDIFTANQATLTETPNGTHVLTFRVTDFFALAPGPHNLTLRAEGQDGSVYEASWSFTMDPTYGGAAGQGVTLLQVVVGVFVLLGLGVVGLVGYVLYLKKTQNFNLRKFLARNPIKKEWVLFYAPIVVAALGALVGMAVAAGMDERPRFMTEYVLGVSGLVAAVPVGLFIRAQARRVVSFEEAYGQFLFEFADAMRGGLDPIKSVKEIAGTEDGTLKKPLRRARDELELGRPFEAVMERMAAPMGSPLIERYARVVGEANKVGGDVSTVVYAAAKDLDELVKLDAARRRAVRTPLMTMYIAFGVMSAMAFILVDFAPSLGDIDLGALTGGSSSRVVPRMDQAEVVERFYHLLLAGGIGTGLLAGAFTQGHVKHGLLHMSIMMGIALFAYPWIVT